MDGRSTVELIEITRQEVCKYEGGAHNAHVFFLADDIRRRYAILLIPTNRTNKERDLVLMLAQVTDDFVIVEADNLWDKNLYQALMAAGVPRQQIILAYAGEAIPQPVKEQNT